MTEDGMVGWHHRLNGHEFEQGPGDGEGQGSLACCSPWGHKEPEATERLNNNNIHLLNYYLFQDIKINKTDCHHLAKWSLRTFLNPNYFKNGFPRGCCLTALNHYYFKHSNQETGTNLQYHCTENLLMGLL